MPFVLNSTRNLEVIKQSCRFSRKISPVSENGTWNQATSCTWDQVLCASLVKLKNASWSRERDPCKFTHSKNTKHLGLFATCTHMFEPTGNYNPGLGGKRLFYLHRHPAKLELRKSSTCVSWTRYSRGFPKRASWLVSLEVPRSDSLHVIQI